MISVNADPIAPDLADCLSAPTGPPLSAARSAVVARQFKAVGDPVRLRLLSLIASDLEGEVCVCELTGAFDLAQPTISHHLKILRESGLVSSERRGTWVYYRASQAAQELLGFATRGTAGR